MINEAHMLFNEVIMCVHVYSRYVFDLNRFRWMGKQIQASSVSSLTERSVGVVLHLQEPVDTPMIVFKNIGQVYLKLQANVDFCIEEALPAKNGCGQTKQLPSTICSRSHVLECVPCVLT